MSGKYKRFYILFSAMALIFIAAILITVFSGNARLPDSRINVAASFYPIYSAALRITDRVEGVNVVNLTPAQTGCLHDYQLTPDNVITLDKADVLLKNGLGMEEFLENIELNPGIRVLDTSRGAALIEGGNEHHLHSDGHDDQDGDYNQHIWMGPSNYIKQVLNIRDIMIEIDPANAQQYKTNAQQYCAEIQALKNQLIAAVKALPTQNCILFHDSLCYFAWELGFNTVESLSLGEDTGVSAGQLAEASLAAEKSGRVILIYDSQYDTEYNSVADKASFVRVLKLDTAVVGNGNDKDAWIDAMKNNLERIREAAN